MRVVIDTVVLVRGLINPRSLCGRLIFGTFDAFELITSSEVNAEYLTVLQRPHLRRKYRKSSSRELDIVLEMIASATLIEPDHVPAICRDPNDDKFIAVALAGRASFIVSEDKDLLDLGVYEGIELCTVETFLRHLDP